MKTQFLFPLALCLTIACGDDKTDTADSAQADCSSEGMDGASLYASNCAGCHAADGSGASGPSLVDAIPTLSDDAVLDTINDGSGTMPAFQGTLDCAEQTAILQYLRDQHGDEGGA